MGNVCIVHTDQAGSIKESGNNEPRDHCLGTNTTKTDDLALGDTIFCRQIDAGKYLDHIEEEYPNETNEATMTSTDPKEEIQIPKAKGSYVLGKVQGMGCVMTVDTACTQTIVSKQLYYRIPRGKRPKLEGQGVLTQAGKDTPPIEVLGRGIFTLQLGPLKLTPRLVVADISDQVLLGDNLLREDPALGPGDIMYSEKILRLGGKRIPLCMVSTPERALCVVSIDDEIIPAMSEKLVDGFLQRPETDIQGESSMLVETNTTFQDRFGCLLTPIVVNTKGKVSTCVRILNPFPQSVLIPGGVTMGELEPVEVLQVVKEKENEGEDHNFEQCRCMVFTTEGRQGTKQGTHDRCQGVHAEFCAGARRAPKQPNVGTSTSCRAEAGPWTERINESTSCRAEAGPRTERINGSASCRAEAGPQIKILNGRASHGAEAGLRTKTINRVSSQGTDVRQQMTTADEGRSQGTETVQRTALESDDVIQ